MPGEVKTRLIPVLGPDKAAGLHTELLRRTLCLANKFGAYSTQLWCSPSIDHAVFRQYAKAFSVSLHTQCGVDLGQRMDCAIQQSLNSAAFALLIGCDCPVLGLDDLRAASRALQHGFDCVLGPAEDGGYVLIGLRRPAPGIFANIDWGTNRVYRQTSSRLTELGINYFELPIRWDVDRPSDLKRYYDLSTTNQFGRF